MRRIAKASGNNDDAPRTATQKAALKRLGVTEEQLAAAPQITPLLKMACGGLKQITDAMRFAPDEVIQTFLRKYDSLDKAERGSLCWEAIALSAGVPVSALLGSIMVSLQAQSVSMVKMIALSGHPEIAKARLRYGTLPSGDRDRQALDQAMGFLPNPKGPMFIGKAVFGSGKNSMDQQKLRRRSGDDLPGDEDEDQDEVPLAARDSEPDLDQLFPPCNLMQEKLQAIRQRLLPQDTETAPKPDRVAALFRNQQVN
jgi:hypothetical protein